MQPLSQIQSAIYALIPEGNGPSGKPLFTTISAIIQELYPFSDRSYRGLDIEIRDQIKAIKKAGYSIATSKSGLRRGNAEDLERSIIQRIRHGASEIKAARDEVSSEMFQRIIEQLKLNTLLGS
ncbi:MAG: hypothetical protein RDU76_06110 [Candidatus Edwardsbacteria bacterium]|nr:hypothetical protein [Candidatus Edwardsbacteria bacterium]